MASVFLRRWRSWDVVVRDLPAALLLLLIALPVFGNTGTRIGSVADRPFDGWALAVAAAQCLPLAVRRRWPATAILVAAAGFLTDQALGYHTVGGTAFALGLISAGLWVRRRRRVVAAVLAVAVAGLLAVTGEPPADAIMLAALLGALWAAGAWLRGNRAREEERRRHVAEATRAAERTRIARELHDVVTHHVTAMVVQAEAARYLTAAPERLEETLTAVTDTGRRAISDLRHLLDVLNPDHGTGTQSRVVGALDTLVEQTRGAGQPVEFAEEGTPARSAGSAELVAYRVVQEALTNALKYARGNRTVVRVHHGSREITVEVGTFGSSAPPRGLPRGGRGLDGLRERVGVLGGEFSAGPREDGFVVRALIPAGSTS